MKSMFFHSIAVCALSVSCFVSGCYLPIRHLVYNNTGEPLKIVIGETVREIKTHTTRKLVIDAYGEQVLIQKGQMIWRYFVVIGKDEEMDFDNRIVRVQIESDGTLYVLRPKTKFPADVGAHSDCVIQVLKPVCR